MINFSTIAVIGACAVSAGAHAATKFAVVEGGNWPNGHVKWVTVPNVDGSGGNYPIPDLNEPSFVSFCKAVDFLQQNTQISFEDMTPSINWNALDGCAEETNFSCAPLDLYDQYKIVQVGRTLGRSYATPYSAAYFYRKDGVVGFGTLRKAPIYNLNPGVSPAVALHELLHLLYAGHEHQRWDRDNYVDIDPVKLSNATSNFDPVNYFKEFMPEPFFINPSTTTNYDGYPFRMYGGFDQASIMRYTDGMLLKLSSSDLLWHIKQPHSGFNRDFRILLKDGTVSPYDNLAINNESGPLAVSTFQDGWSSTQFDIEYVGTFWNALSGKNEDRFTIRHKSGQYLFDNNGVISFVDIAGLASAGGSAQWNLEVGAADGDFSIKSNGSKSRYMSNSGNNLTLAEAKPSTPWIIKARTLVDERPETLRLSMMDKVGLHINYGKKFTIKHKDGTPNNLSDNPMVGQYQNGSTLSLKATVPTYGISLWYFTQCGQSTKSTRSDTLCINDAVFNHTVRTNTAGTLIQNVPNSVTTDFERWQLIPRKEGFFHIKNLVTGKYWSKPQTVNGVTGVITMVDQVSAGEWLLNDVPVDEDEDGDISYKEGKQRSQSCVDALNAADANQAVVEGRAPRPVGIDY